MDLSQIRVEARLRRPWEAIDLGFVLARQWWKPLLLSWIVPSFALYCVLSLLFYQRAWVAPLVIWWLKPFWDRGPLYVASRALFGERLAMRQILGASFGIYKTDWLAWLCWRRFNVSRSYVMPVTVLENLHGRARQSRLAVLRSQNASAAHWLTAVCAHLEGLTIFGTIGLTILMLPPESQFDAMEFMLVEEGVMQHVVGLLSYGAMALLAPFYTMAGFALYISRRIELEAWDIEIRFRHLADTHNQQGHKMLRSACFLLALALLWGTPRHIDAAPPVNPRQQSKILIDDVLSGDDFHKRVQSKRWRLKNRQVEEGEDRQDVPAWLQALVDFFARHGHQFGAVRDVFSLGARGVEIMLWVIAISLALWFFYRYRESLRQFIGGANREGNNTASPGVLFGLDVSQESLPEDVPVRVLALWQAERYRAALSLLYRATLSSLIHRYDFAFGDEHTEAECAAIVRQRGNSRLSAYTEQLTHCWQQLAYGHRLPESELVAGMCKQWQEIFYHES